MVEANVAHLTCLCGFLTRRSKDYYTRQDYDEEN